MSGSCLLCLACLSSDARLSSTHLRHLVCCVCVRVCGCGLGVLVVQGASKCTQPCHPCVCNSEHFRVRDRHWQSQRVQTDRSFMGPICDCHATRGRLPGLLLGWSNVVKKDDAAQHFCDCACPMHPADRYLVTYPLMRSLCVCIALLGKSCGRR